MSLPVEISPEAERNFAECYNYIHIRNPDAADRWANAFYAALKSPEQNPYRGRAPEDEHHAAELRQVLFKTRQGAAYRAIFMIRKKDVVILHIRGPGQDVMQSEEIFVPDPPSGN